MTAASLSPQTRAATVAEHYRRLAGRYDEFLYYSPRFVRTLTSRMTPGSRPSGYASLTRSITVVAAAAFVDIVKSSFRSAFR